VSVSQPSRSSNKLIATFCAEISVLVKFHQLHRTKSLRRQRGAQVSFSSGRVGVPR
jgi:hypothetical protein